VLIGIEQDIESSLTWWKAKRTSATFTAFQQTIGCYGANCAARAFTHPPPESIVVTDSSQYGPAMELFAYHFLWAVAFYRRLLS
jgi:hypothetical protein